jgi:hypothetical protein
MTDEAPGPEFWKRADEVIHLANQQREDETNHKVGASLLYAAARFNAFVAASSTQDVEEMKSEKAEALEYFCDQFRTALSENLDDYTEHYKDYIEKFRAP